MITQVRKSGISCHWLNNITFLHFTCIIVVVITVSVAAAVHVGSWFCICRGLLFLITTNFEETKTPFKTPTSSSTPSDDTIIWSRLNTQSAEWALLRCVYSSLLQSHQKKAEQAVDGNEREQCDQCQEGLPPSQANTRDRGCLITRYSANTCCVKGAKAETKDLNFKTSSKKREWDV